jgi:hypothetical protein
LHARLGKVLGEVDDRGTRGSRLLDDGARLWLRAQRFIKMQLVGPDLQADALELACFAMQFPLQRVESLPVGKFGHINLRDRSELAAEMMLTTLADEVPEELLDRTARILHELPQRTPVLDEAKLLADAVNLEDFGVSGLVMAAIQTARAGGGAGDVASGSEKREQYGYWQARLKDGFHFQPVRQIAERRLEHYRQAATLLMQELAEDRP